MALDNLVANNNSMEIFESFLCPEFIVLFWKFALEYFKVRVKVYKKIILVNTSFNIVTFVR